MDVLKAINFDLDTKALQQYYPSSNWRKAYEDINKFFLSNGFEHRQGSGYISLIKTDDYSVLTLTRKLSITMPWLSKCVQHFDVTDIGEQFDMLGIIKGAAPEMDIDSVDLSNKSEYIAKLEDIELISDKIQDALDNGELNLDRDMRSAEGQAR